MVRRRGKKAIIIINFCTKMQLYRLCMNRTSLPKSCHKQLHPKDKTHQKRPDVLGEKETPSKECDEQGERDCPSGETGCTCVSLRLFGISAIKKLTQKMMSWKCRYCLNPSSPCPSSANSSISARCADTMVRPEWSAQKRLLTSPWKSPKYIFFNISLASSECPTSSKASVASRPNHSH